MSEYMERHSVARLIGAPPGYVGYDEGGQLTEAVRRKPYSILLLDEIEKAHHDVFNILLQVLDEGRLTDNQGRTVDFRNTIIIMTSNLGASTILEKAKGITEQNRDEVYESIKNEMETILHKGFRPEFLNRVDDIIVFKPLTIEQIKEIVELQFRFIQQKAASKGVTAELAEGAVELLAEEGFDPAFGARPVKRVLQKEIANKISDLLLKGELKKGDNLRIERRNNSLDFVVKSG